MLESKQNRYMGDTPLKDKVTFVTATTTLSMDEQVVRASSSGSAYTIKLPSVAAAAGRIYSIFATAISGTITVADNDDDTKFTNISLLATDKFCVVYSDGINWYTLASG